MSSPTSCKVPPTPLSKFVTDVAAGTPAASATTAEPTISDRNGCIFAKTIRPTMTAMPIAATTSSLVSWAPQTEPPLYANTAAGS